MTSFAILMLYIPEQVEDGVHALLLGRHREAKHAGGVDPVEQCRTHPGYPGCRLEYTTLEDCS